jgi:hypothetical protein
VPGPLIGIRSLKTRQLLSSKQFIILLEVKWKMRTRSMNVDSVILCHQHGGDRREPWNVRAQLGFKDYLGCGGWRDEGQC